MKDSSNTLSLTFDEFSHIRNVITRAELETLLFNEKLYAEVAQGKVENTSTKPNLPNLLFFYQVMFYMSESAFQLIDIYIWHSM